MSLPLLGGTDHNRFLLVCHDAGGTIPPVLALSERLLRAGHEVTVLSQPSVQSRAEATGADFVAFDGIGSYDAHRPIEEQFEVVLPVFTGRQVGDQLKALASGLNCDLVVVDCNMAGAAAAAESLNLPSAILMHSLYRTFLDLWIGPLWAFMEQAINDTRGAYGLDAASCWPDVFAGHELVLSVVPPSFDELAEPPSNLRYTGFLVPGPWERHAEVFPAGERPRVLVSLSTTYLRQEDLLSRTVEAMAQVDADVLVTTGPSVDPATLNPPDNVRVVGFLPHYGLVDECDLVVTHGGLGTVATALSAGVPLLCLPIGRDQPLNAQRVAAAGAGSWLAPGSEPSEIAAGVARSISDVSLEAAALRLAQETRTIEADRSLARLLSSLVSDR